VATIDIKKPSAQREHEGIAAHGTTPESGRGNCAAIWMPLRSKRSRRNPPSATRVPPRSPQDLRRYLDGKPIEALPSRFTDRLRKFMRRNKNGGGGSPQRQLQQFLPRFAYTLHREP